MRKSFQAVLDEGLIPRPHFCPPLGLIFALSDSLLLWGGGGSFCSLNRHLHTSWLSLSVLNLPSSAGHVPVEAADFPPGNLPPFQQLLALALPPPLPLGILE